MTDVNHLISEHLDVWTSAIEKKSSAGRGNGRGISLHGIKKLRELVLELAVRGKLVPHDTSQGTAEFLLSEYGRRRARGIRERRFKKQNLGAALSNSEIPFDIPSSWRWARLGEIGFVFNGNSVSARAKAEKYSSPDGLPFIATKNVGYGFESLDYDVDAWIPPGEPKFKVAPAKTPLICSEGGSAGKKCGLTDQDVCFGNKLFACEFYGEFEPKFLLAWYLCPSFFSEFSEQMTGIIGGISLAKFLRLPVPIPPIEEQRSIMKKVDELMALCNALERQSENSIKAHQTLVETCLATLTNSQSPDDLIQNWTRIEIHFDTLFTTEASVEALRKASIELGAMGLLTRNVSGGTNPETILEQVAKEKSQLISQGIIRREKALKPVDPSDFPFQLPSGWVWAKVGDLALFTQYGTSQKATKHSNGVSVLAMGNIQGGAVTLESEKALPPDWEEFPALLLEPGDLLYNRTNSAELVGKTGLFDGPESEFTFASYLIRIRLSARWVRPKYLNYAMNSPYFRRTQVVPHIKKQTGQANVNGTILKNMLVPLPPTEEQDAIIDRIEALHGICSQLHSKLNQVGTLERSLADTLTSKIH